MDMLLEFLFELVFEGIVELGTNRKVPNYIRWPLVILLFLFFAGVIGGLFLIGIMLLKENLLVGILMMGLGILFLIGLIFRIRQYRKKHSL